MVSSFYVFRTECLILVVIAKIFKIISLKHIEVLLVVIIVKISKHIIVGQSSVKIFSRCIVWQHAVRKQQNRKFFFIAFVVLFHCSQFHKKCPVDKRIINIQNLCLFLVQQITE